MPDMQLLSSPAEVDLTNHGVIEAHAGTGKTYTIVQLVLRLLQGESAQGKTGRAPLHIRNLLLVTYTDKAAGELRARIREGLADALAKATPGSPAQAHFSDCLANLHEAMIGTIHSVCLRILRTWPFDTGVQFQTTQCDEDAGLESALYRVLREDWQRAGSPEAQVLAMLSEGEQEVADKHRTLIRKLAKELLAEPHSALSTHALHSFVGCSEFLATREQKAVQWETESLAAVRQWLPTYLELVQRILALADLKPEHAEKFRAKVKVFEAALEAGDFSHPECSDPARWNGTIITDGKNKIHKSNPEIFRVAMSECAASLAAALQPHKLAHTLRTETHKPGLMALLCGSARLVAQRWQREKQQRGQISFQDMLRLVHKAVMENPAMVLQLRAQLRYGIIDEFQDTSALQWQIFRQIFLYDDSAQPARLLLVGDPKQSIYAFQGADVGSYAEARAAVAARGGKLYGLVRNFRSLPAVIEGYNTLLAPGDREEDWFRHPDISYPGDGPGGCVAQAPDRAQAMPNAAESSGYPFPALQVIPIWGKSEERKQQLANHISLVIRSLVGTSIAVAKGDKWDQLTLSYSDFAIVTETNKAAVLFLNQLAADGVPAMKYKLQGVFQSSMCRHVAAMLRAVDPATGGNSERLAALLTPFFESHPAAIDPAKVLEPGSPAMKLFQQLREHAEQRRWGQFFAALQSGTGIGPRIARLFDGERQLGDLRQVLDHCLDCLAAHNWSLTELVEHLGRLLAEEETLADDKNLHTLASAKAAVKVLTMHASKGLEFPVVFLVTTSGGDSSKPPTLRSWSAGDGTLALAPQLNKGDWELAGGAPWEAQRKQERRRLHYVALTRPKAALFVPLHLESEPASTDAGVDWSTTQCETGVGGDPDLSPRLLELLRAGRLQAFDEKSWQARPKAELPKPLDHLDAQWSLEGNEAYSTQATQLKAALRGLDLPHRRSLQTSYTELSRGMEHDRELGAAEEFDEAEAYQESALPRGKDTGDALHGVLEECIGHIAWQDLDIKSMLSGRLLRGGVLKRLQTEQEVAAAVTAAERMVRLGMTATYDMGAFGKVSLNALLADATLGSCRAELEFQLAHQPDWLHGFMDVVFRLADISNPRHPWRYFVLDWKTNSLPRYDLPHIAASVRESHYDLQAKVYCHALHVFLQGLLGTDYDAAANLGAGVYVYLRGFEQGEEVPVWCHTADPAADAEFVKQSIAAWKEEIQ